MNHFFEQYHTKKNLGSELRMGEVKYVTVTHVTLYYPRGFSFGIYHSAFEIMPPFGPNYALTPKNPFIFTIILCLIPLVYIYISLKIYPLMCLTSVQCPILYFLIISDTSGLKSGCAAAAPFADFGVCRARNSDERRRMSPEWPVARLSPVTGPSDGGCLRKARLRGCRR